MWGRALVPAPHPSWSHREVAGGGLAWPDPYSLVPLKAGCGK